MKNAVSSISSVAGAVVAVIKGLIVAFVFANILYTTGFDPIGGVVDLVNIILNNTNPKPEYT